MPFKIGDLVIVKNSFYIEDFRKVLCKIAKVGKHGETGSYLVARHQPDEGPPSISDCYLVTHVDLKLYEFDPVLVSCHSRTLWFEGKWMIDDKSAELNDGWFGGNDTILVTKGIESESDTSNDELTFMQKIKGISSNVNSIELIYAGIKLSECVKRGICDNQFPKRKAVKISSTKEYIDKCLKNVPTNVLCSDPRKPYTGEVERFRMYRYFNRLLPGIKIDQYSRFVGHAYVIEDLPKNIKPEMFVKALTTCSIEEPLISNDHWSTTKQEGRIPYIAAFRTSSYWNGGKRPPYIFEVLIRPIVVPREDIFHCESLKRGVLEVNMESYLLEAVIPVPFKLSQKRLHNLLISVVHQLQYVKSFIPDCQFVRQPHSNAIEHHWDEYKFKVYTQFAYPSAVMPCELTTHLVQTQRDHVGCIDLNLCRFGSVNEDYYFDLTIKDFCPPLGSYKYGQRTLKYDLKNTVDVGYDQDLYNLIKPTHIVLNKIQNTINHIDRRKIPAKKSPRKKPTNSLPKSTKWPLKTSPTSPRNKSPVISNPSSVNSKSSPINLNLFPVSSSSTIIIDQYQLQQKHKNIINMLKDT